MGWRTKFVFLLIVYCAGFATAVYCLTPTSELESDQGGSLQFARMPAAFKSEELAKSVSSGIHKCVDLSKEAAEKLARRIQDEIKKAQSESDK